MKQIYTQRLTQEEFNIGSVGFHCEAISAIIVQIYRQLNGVLKNVTITTLFH